MSKELPRGVSGVRLCKFADRLFIFFIIYIIISIIVALVGFFSTVSTIRSIIMESVKKGGNITGKIAGESLNAASTIIALTVAVSLFFDLLFAYYFMKFSDKLSKYYATLNDIYLKLLEKRIYYGKPENPDIYRKYVFYRASNSYTGYVCITINYLL